jgi:hypothetical protein
MKSRHVTWASNNKPEFRAGTFVSTAMISHRRGKRTLVTHRRDERCDLCTEHQKKERDAAPRFFSYPTRPGRDDGEPIVEVDPEGTPFTPFSHRLMNSSCLEDAISKSWKKEG